MQFDPPVIAHRGASAYAPENTMVAFTRAAQLEISWIEFDVMLAACGTPIVFHDETLDRTTSGAGAIGGYPYSFLQSLDAGRWFGSAFSGERIPTLSQVLNFIQDANMNCNLEIKPLPGQEEETVTQAIKVLRSYGSDILDKILFSSFSAVSLKKLHQLLPECQKGLLMDVYHSSWESQVEAFNCVSVHASNDCLTAQIAHEIKAKDKLLLCYTVNDTDRAEELFSWGVDAVFSDCPDKMARFVY